METMRKHNNFVINVKHIFIVKMRLTDGIVMLRGKG